MLLELGPVESTEVNSWIKFARRVICELRLDPSDLRGIATEDMLSPWSTLVDEWGRLAASGPTFRWSAALEAERAEYLLHGFERCIGSEIVRKGSTAEELNAQRPFSMHIVQAFVDALSDEGRACQHYVDQVRTSVGHQLDH